MLEEFWARYFVCFGLGFVIGFFLGDIISSLILKRSHFIKIPHGTEILKGKKGER